MPNIMRRAKRVYKGQSHSCWRSVNDCWVTACENADRDRLRGRPRSPAVLGLQVQCSSLAAAHCLQRSIATNTSGKDRFCPIRNLRSAEPS